MTYPTDAEAYALADTMTYPCFVYGTLRPGHGNDRLWRGRARDQYDGEVYVAGYRLVGRGFPYAVPEPAAEAVGCLIVPDTEQYDDVMLDLDRLEGVPSHYTRELVVAVTPEGWRCAWMYVAGYWAGDTERTGSPVPTDANGRYDWALR